MQYKIITKYNEAYLFTNPLNIMTKQSLYTVEWLDDHNEPYDTLEDLTYKQMVHYRQEAKYMHLDIRVTKQNS